jgi:serine/alanine adding enzyme
LRLTELGIEQADRWLEFYERVDASLIDVFDLPGYMKACESAEHGTPKCLVVEDGDSLLLYPLLIDKISGFDGMGDITDTSSPYGYGGTITNQSSSNQHFFNGANSLIDDWMIDQNVVSEFIRTSPYKAGTNIRPGDYVQVRTNVQVETSSPDESWSTLSSSAKRNIRKSQANGLSVSIDERGTTMKEFAEFYTKFARSRDWDEFYQFPWKYFEQIQDNLPENSFIVRAELDGKLVAGALFLTSDSITHFHLGASDPEHLGMRPNDAIFWEAIRYSAESGKHTLQLGGGTGMSSDDPLFRFKSKFGKTQLPVHVGKRVTNQSAYDELIKQWSAKNNDAASSNSQILQRYRN